MGGIVKRGSIGWEAARANKVANNAEREAVRRIVYAEETHCHLCSLRVDQGLHYLDPGAPTLDELIPATFGGSVTDRRNIRLAHRECNTRRGNRSLEEWFKTFVKPGTLVTSRKW